MLHTQLARSATWLLSAILGGTGMFCLIECFSLPWLALHALLLLGAAAAIVGLTQG